MDFDSFIVNSSSDFFSPANEAREQLCYHLINTVLQNTDTSGMSRHERSEVLDYIHYKNGLMAHSQYSPSPPPPPPYFSPLYYWMQQLFVFHPSPVANIIFVADERSTDYEDLLELQERIGRVNVGLSEERISKNLKTSHIHVVKEDECELCVVCQEEYRDKDMIGSLGKCGHKYHASCINNWLLQKNVCTICKATALVI